MTWKPGDRDPPPRGWTLGAKAAPWPSDWRPEVIEEGNAVEVAFYLYSGHMMSRIWREVDRYARGSLRFQTREEHLAGGPPGFVY